MLKEIEGALWKFLNNLFGKTFEEIHQKREEGTIGGFTRRINKKTFTKFLTNFLKEFSEKISENL